METWLLDGTRSLSQVCLYNFRKKFKEENGHSTVREDGRCPKQKKRDCVPTAFNTTRRCSPINQALLFLMNQHRLTSAQKNVCRHMSSQHKKCE